MQEDGSTRPVDYFSNEGVIIASRVDLHDLRMTISQMRSLSAIIKDPIILVNLSQYRSTSE